MDSLLFQHGKQGGYRSRSVRASVLCGLILLPLSVFAAATSSSFSVENDQPVLGGGRQSSASFSNVGIVGQPLGGRATSSSFSGDFGAAFGNAAAPGTLTVTDSSTGDATANFTLSYPDADPDAPQFMVCYGVVSADVAASCSGTATQAFTTAFSYQFSGLANNTTYYFKAYPLAGYDSAANPILSPTPTSVVSSSRVRSTVFLPVSGGSGGGTGGGGGGSSSAGGGSANSVASYSVPSPSPVAPAPAPLGVIARIASFFEGVAASVLPSTPSVPVPAALPADDRSADVAPGDIPARIVSLVRQFPDLKKTFGELGIVRAADVVKAAGIRFAVPSVQKLAEVPAGVVLVRAVGSGLGLKTFISFDASGSPRQALSVPGGQKVVLSVRPDAPAERVDGYMTYGKDGETRAPRVRTDSLAASVILAQAPLTAPAANKPEKRLLAKEFAYAEKNGIFEADVRIPDAAQNVTITTVITYEDKSLPAQDIDLSVTVDPHGYVYEQSSRGKIRVEGARVTLWQCPAGTLVLRACAEKNSFVTEENGDYVFLVPPGKYQLKADAKGYVSYVGEPFVVTDANSVAGQIELKPKSWIRSLFGF